MNASQQQRDHDDDKDEAVIGRAQRYYDVSVPVYVVAASSGFGYIFSQFRNRSKSNFMNAYRFP